MSESRKIEILLVEDSVTDAELAMEALDEGVDNHVHVVRDGLEAMAYLQREDPYQDAVRPDIILLDLNMPRMDGKQVLAKLHSMEELRTIPVVVLTTSKADRDVFESYGLNANSYIVKPVDLDQFYDVIRKLKKFWFQVVRLPPKP